MRLHRSRDGEPGWSEADLPLLDEATALLGPLPAAGAGAGGVDPIEAMLAEQMVERVMEDVEGSGGPLTRLDAELTHALQERVRATALGATAEAAVRAPTRSVPTGTWSSTRPRSSRRWRGGCCGVGAPPVLPHRR